MTEYLNFDLELSGYTAAEDSFLIRAARVPGFGEQRQPQKVFISKKLREHLPALAFRDLARADLVALGIEIGNALLPGGQAGDQSVRELFFKARDRLQSHEKLRLRLKINELENFELATLPWEFAFLRDSNTPISQAQISDFLALDQRISVVRSEVLTGEALRQYPQVNGPIGLLALLISPKTAAKFPALDLQPELDAIQTVVEKLGQRVRAHYLNAINGDTGLQKLLINHTGTHILHFAGHGYFAKEMGDAFGQTIGRGGLVLADDQGEARLVPVETLAPVLRGRDLRLVVLAACEGAQRDAVNAWSGVAPALIRAGIPAVVGMQYSISNANATQFSDLFYTALTLGAGVDEALYEARLAMSQAGDTALQTEFGFPALYLRMADEQSELVLFPAHRATANGHSHPLPPTRPEALLPAEGLTAEPIRLDVAAADKVIVGQTFELAVAIRQPGSPVLKLEDLPKVSSAEGAIFRAEGQKFVKYRVEVSSPDCEVADAAIQFLLEKDKDSAVQYFQLTAKRAGKISIVVNAYQEGDLLAASTRTQVVAEVEAQPKPKKETTSEAMPDARTLREYLNKHFSETDLETLCVDLSLELQSAERLKEGEFISLETVGGGSKPAKILNLIQYLQRRSWLAALITEVRKTQQAKDNPI